MAPSTRFLSVLVGILLLAQVTSEMSDAAGLYGGQQSAIVVSFTDVMSSPSLPTVATIDEVLPGDRLAAVYLLLSLKAIGGLGLLLNFLPTAAVILSWLAHVVMFNSYIPLLYGADSTITAILFYLVALLAFPTESRSITVFARCHLSVIYLASGLAKLEGDQWWSGEALWYAVAQPQFAGNLTSALLALFSEYQCLLKSATWAVLLIEIGYPMVLFVRSARNWSVWAVVLLHIGIAAVMGLWIFSGAMIVLNFLAFPEVLLRAVKALTKSRWAKVPDVGRGCPIRC